MAFITFAGSAVLALVFFPYASDGPLSEKELADVRSFYAGAYDRGSGSNSPSEAQDPNYVRIAKAAAEHFDIKGAVSEFAQKYGLANGKVLDVGAGRGYLQDVVPNYTGLDISSSAKEYFHKEFVLGSATSMPFPDGAFDGAWSIWVLEHVPNPEAALREIRRVVKDGGYVYLLPAWDCTPYAAQGYPVRPYSDFGIGGRIQKATIPLQLFAWTMAKVPVRLTRYALWKATGGGPTKLRYRRLTPNYERYWMPDSDAISSLSRVEMALWFQSRGDECLNCRGDWDEMTTLEQSQPLILRIRKGA